MTKNIDEIGWEIVGNPDGNSKMTKEEYEELKAVIDRHIANYTPEQIKETNLFRVLINMRSYIDKPIKDGETLEIGHFINELLKIYNLKNKDLADQLGLTKSNFSALMNGKRKINFDLAIKLGKIFGIKPKLWLDVQNKNELWRLENSNKEKYEKYTLGKLLNA